jgi:dTDP-4-dehydrorhamnose reductase
MIKTAVIGASGYVGRHLWNSFRQVYPDCVGTSFANRGDGLIPFDIREPNLAALRLEESGHQAVLIASAKPNIGFCEQQQAAAHAVNVRGMLELLRQIGRTSLTAIFLSSDYVFDGSTGAYADTVKPRPTTEYGRQKAEVEREIPSLVKNYLVLRLSKIYGLQQGDGTLLTDLARALTAGEEIQAAADQFFCPTLVTDLVRAIHAIQQARLTGIVNVAAPEFWSRYQIAAALAEVMQVNPSRLRKIALYDLPSMKGRPLNTTMTCSRLREETAVGFTPLRDSINRVGDSYSARTPAQPR